VDWPRPGMDRVKAFAFARPGPEGVELCVVRRRDGGDPELVIVPIAPMRALELAHELAEKALPQLKETKRCESKS
jgi:hypothetical protein